MGLEGIGEASGASQEGQQEGQTEREDPQEKHSRRESEREAMYKERQKRLAGNKDEESQEAEAQEPVGAKTPTRSRSKSPAAE